MNKYKNMIQDEVFNLKTKMTDNEFLSSNQYFSFLDEFIQGVLFGYERGKQITVYNYADATSDETACTNGYRVRNNTLDPIIQVLPTRAMKHYAICGKVCHEIWHILFSDFSALHKHSDVMAGKKFKWPYKMTASNADDVCNKLNADKTLRSVFTSFQGDVVNILEDGYVNRRGCALMPGVPAAGNKIYDDKMMEIYGSYQKILSQDIMTATMMTFQAQAFRYEPAGLDSLSTEQKLTYDHIQSFIDESWDYVIAALKEKNGEKRMAFCDEVSCTLFPLVEEFVKTLSPQCSQQGQNSSDDMSSDAGQSGSGSSSTQSSDGSPSSNQGSLCGQLSEQQVEQILQNMADKLQQTVAPEGNNAPIKDKDNDSDDFSEKGEQSSNSGQYSSSAEKAFENIENQVMQAIAENKVEQEHSSDLVAEGRQIMNHLANQPVDRSVTKEEKKYNNEMNYSLSLSPLHVVRKADATSFEGEYQRVYEKVADEVEATVRKLKKILKEHNNAYQSGFRMGRMNTKAVAKQEFFQDGKIFTRRNEKTLKTVAFSILIDESGSMNGRKCLTARMIAIELEAILREVGVSLMVVGHSCYNGNLPINVYVDFDTVDKADRFRLIGTHATGCNEDGVAIAYCCEKLQKRSEDKKVLIVISDGEPSAHCDSLNLAIETVKKYRQKKIDIFGAVIDGNIQAISRIYNERTLDCIHGNLGTELVNLVKRYVLR